MCNKFNESNRFNENGHQFDQSNQSNQCTINFRLKGLKSLKMIMYITIKQISSIQNSILGI